ncbi:MAG TPA: MoaD/ThiS family protein [Candidatus Bathyarchaeia archaeon]|nr:MoaD/ThiS family protein [Candidatus Bathyarchaeia archaeon]
MTITVKFVGALRHAAGRETRLVDCGDCSVKELICNLTQRKPELRRNLIDEELGDQRPKALILVNGREISVINGLNTALKDGDTVILVPVAHGG